MAAMTSHSEMFLRASETHRKVFLRCLGVIGAFAIVVPIAISHGLNVPLRTCFWYEWDIFILALLLMLLRIIVRRMNGKRRGGAVLLDFGKDDRFHSLLRSQWFVFVVFPGLAVNSAIHEQYLMAVAYAALTACYIAYWRILSAPVQIWEHGFNIGSRFVKWQQIQEYEWTGDGQFLIYRIRQWIPAFDFGSIRVPDHQREAFTSLIKQYVPSSVVQETQ